MTEISINLVFEDYLSGTVMERLCDYAAQGSISRFRFGAKIHCRGFGKIKTNAENYNDASKRMINKQVYYFILTDLDQNSCAPGLINAWLKTEKSPNLIFRIAVREVEAWLLADCDNLLEYLRVAKKFMINHADTIDDPKAYLISMARHSRNRQIREDIVPRPGARIGPGYNHVLSEFVIGHWNVQRAVGSSPSLNKTVCVLQDIFKNEK